MPFCPTCGTQVPDDATFCPTCGRQLHGGAPSPGGGGPPPIDPPVSPVATPHSAYPARLEIEYPDRALNRLSTFFRVFAVIPIAIVLGMVDGGSLSWYSNSRGGGGETLATGGGILILPLVLMLLFRRKYPGWWFDWNLELTRFSTRVSAYLLLLDDRYPSTDEQQAVHLDLDRPDGAQLSRLLPLIKWLLAIPHVLVLLALGIGAVFVVVIAWFAILFTGRYPRWAFDYVVGVMRWFLRVEAYAVLLITDRYPPFSMAP
jgi:hypothetical protein